MNWTVKQFKTAVKTLFHNADYFSKETNWKEYSQSLFDLDVALNPSTRRGV